MKIYAESQIVEVPVYSHVGYLATQTFNPHYPILSVGIVLLLLGTIISGQFRMYKTDKKFITLIKHPTKKIITGFIVSAIGIVVGVLAFFPFSSETWDHPESVSRGHTRVISEQVVEYICEMKKQGKDVEIPADLKVIQKLFENSEEYMPTYLEDGWYNPMKIEIKEYKGRKIYYVTSPGRNGRFGTDDDIVYPKKEDDYNYIFDLYREAEDEVRLKEQAQTRQSGN